MNDLIDSVIFSEQIIYLETEKLKEALAAVIKLHESCIEPCSTIKAIEKVFA